MTDKKFWLSADQITPDLARNEACIASDRITVDGRPVGFMFRDYSGWNFFAGDESQEYVDDAANLGLYSLNTIANHDGAILPHLDARHGTAWLRDGSRFIEDPEGAPIDPDATYPYGLNPDFPWVEGRFDMAEDCSIALPEPMNRRVEDGQLVLWRPGLTAWITVWGNNEEPRARLAKILQGTSSAGCDRKDWATENILFHSYRLDEQSADGRAPALYAAAVGQPSHVQIAVYFDDETDLVSAEQLVHSIRMNTPNPTA